MEFHVSWSHAHGHQCVRIAGVSLWGSVPKVHPVRCGEVALVCPDLLAGVLVQHGCWELSSWCPMLSLLPQDQDFGGSRKVRKQGDGKAVSLLRSLPYSSWDTFGSFQMCKWAAELRVSLPCDKGFLLLLWSLWTPSCQGEMGEIKTNRLVKKILRRFPVKWLPS